MEKFVCFLGHRDLWHCGDVQQKLKQVLISMIKKGYVNFYDGYHGAFDELCLKTLIELKNEYNINIFKVLSSYNCNDNYLPDYYTDTIYPNLEYFYYKQRITKRNEWIIEHSDVVITHIEFNINSGAYRGVKYAEKLGKEIIFI